jgi:hypothetical protein
MSRRKSMASRFLPLGEQFSSSVRNAELLLCGVCLYALYYKPESRGFDTRRGNFLNLLNPFGRTRPGVTQPLIEMSTRNIKIIMFLGSKVRPMRRADNLTAICEPIV